MADHEEHWHPDRLTHLLGTFGKKAKQLHKSDGGMGNELATPARSPKRLVPSGRCFQDVTFERLVPGDFVRAVGRVLFVVNLKAHISHSLTSELHESEF